MSFPLKEILTSKGINPPGDQLPQLESKWLEIQALKHDLDEWLAGEADIALRNVPGGTWNG